MPRSYEYTIICYECGTKIQEGNSNYSRSQLCKDCKDQMLMDYPIRDLIASILPDGKHHAGYDEYFCPFHGDQHGRSFVVREYACKCFAGCSINGREWADQLDFLTEYHKLQSFREAAQVLSGKIYAEPPPMRVYEKEAPTKPITMADVERLHQNVAEAMQWWHERCVSTVTVNDKRLGFKRDWPHTYEFKLGPRAGEKVRLTTRHYSIPNIFYDQVFYVKMRRDDAYTLDQLRLLDPKFLDAVREEEQLRQLRNNRPVVELTEVDLMNLLYKRYPQMRGAKDPSALYNAQRFVRRTESGPEYLPFEYALINEGEIKCDALESAGGDGYGYASVSNIRDPRIGRVLQNVKRPILIRDPDAAGDAVVEAHREWIPNLEVITAPDGLKAADDVIKAGLVHEWLGSHGIYPIKLERTHA